MASSFSEKKSAVRNVSSIETALHAPSRRSSSRRSPGALSPGTTREAIPETTPACRACQCRSLTSAELVDEAERPERAPERLGVPAEVGRGRRERGRLLVPAERQAPAEEAHEPGVHLVPPAGIDAGGQERDGLGHPALVELVAELGRPGDDA